MRSLPHLLLTALLALALSGCLYPVRYDGPYLGRVIDEETREPIEGVAVLGTWDIFHNNLAGGNHTFYDARETVTDKKGEFTVEGMGLRMFSNLDPMRVLIFKSGYSYIGPASWPAFKISSYARERIKWEGDRAILPIKKLSPLERERQSAPYFPAELQSKKTCPKLIREINKEETFLGRTPYPED
jgi:hypothetical protein